MKLVLTAGGPITAKTLNDDGGTWPLYADTAFAAYYDGTSNTLMLD